MSGKKYFFWLGVMDSVYLFGQKSTSNWPMWQRKAYADGFYSGRQQCAHKFGWKV